MFIIVLYALNTFQVRFVIEEEVIMNKNYCVIFSREVGLYIAMTSENGLLFLSDEEGFVRGNLTKEQALELANDLN